MEGCTGKEIKRSCFESIRKMRARFSVEWLCALYGVSKSGYYRWLHDGKQPNSYEALHKEIDEMVYRQHTAHPGYGYRSVHAALLRETGWILGNHAVLKSMQRLRVHSKARPKKKYLVGIEHPRFPNILDRRFEPAEPFRKIATDICCFRNRGIRYYFVAYLDLFNNEISTWNPGRKEDLSLILPPLKKLPGMRPTASPLPIHSGQGSRYASFPYVKPLRDNGVVQSMSRAGTPRGNAVIESCFGWFKDMLRYDFNVSHDNDVFGTVTRAVEHFSKERPAYALDYKTPAQLKAVQGL